jgi:predicted nucleic acid-binding protein
VLVLFEIRRHALRKAVPHGTELLKSIRRACTIVPVTGPTALRAARMSYGTGIPAMDALILASLISAGCTVVYTRDPDLERFRSRRVRIINLERHGE